MRKSTSTIIFAFLFTFSVLVSGYIMLGLLPVFIFALGFFWVILWLIIPTSVSFRTIKTPYFLTLAFFDLHKYE